MDNDPDWLEFQACSRRSRQIIHQLHSRRSGQTAAPYTTTSMPQMPEKEPGRAYTANERTDAIWEAMEDAEIARRDTENDLVLSDSEDEPATANPPTQPAALPPPQPSTRASSSTLPTVNVPTKSGFSRIGSPRILCRCSCGCSHGYYERKRGSSSASAPQPPTTQSTSSAPTLPTLTSINLTGPHPGQMAQSVLLSHPSGQTMVDSVLQPHNTRNFEGAEGDAGQQVVSRAAVDRQGRDTSAEKVQAVVAQEMETDSSTANAAAGD
ncbi:hypothetical protein LTS10_001606 [Elasticomyces elasticus]|nr:hypothetical protein LTS10_001606 [Elasticomyces elasticus]